MIMKATFGQHLRSTGSSDSRPSLFFPPISSSSSSSSSQSSSFTGAAMLYWNKEFSIVYGVCTELWLWAGEYYFWTIENSFHVIQHHTQTKKKIFFLTFSLMATLTTSLSSFWALYFFLLSLSACLSASCLNDIHIHHLNIQLYCESFL